jgi:hypothetical protein
LVEILKVVDECCRDLSIVDVGESLVRASGEAEELRRWSDGSRALGDAGGWLVVTLVPFAVWIDGEGMGRCGVVGPVAGMGAEIEAKQSVKSRRNSGVKCRVTSSSEA